MDFGDQIHRTLALLRERPGRPRAAARPLPLRPGGRVPGHEPRPARDAEARWPGRRPTSPWWATTTRPSTAGAARPPPTCWRSAGSTRARARWCSPRTTARPRSILDAAARLIGYNNPYRLEAIAGIDKRLRSPRAERPARCATAHFDTVSAEADGVAAMVEERIQAGARPRDFAILVRSNADADPFLRALNVKGLPHRFSGSRGLYAREEVRLLVSFLRVLANPDDSVSLFYLVASEVYGMPEIDLLRLNHYARRKTRPLLEVLRGAARERGPRLGLGRRPARRRRGSSPTSSGPPPRCRGGAPARCSTASCSGRACSGGCAKESSAEAEAKVKNIAPLLRDGEGLRRRGRARPRARVRRAPRPAARGRRRPGGGRGRPRRGRGPRPHRAQGQGPRVPGRLPGGLRRVEVPAAAAGRPAGPARGAREGGAHRRRQRPPRSRSGASSTSP